MTTQQNGTPVEAMNLQEFIRRAINAAQANETYIQCRLDAVTSPLLFPHQIANRKGMLITDEALLHGLFLTTPEERPTDGVFAVVCNVSRQRICISFEWVRGDKHRQKADIYPLRKPVW